MLNEIKLDLALNAGYMLAKKEIEIEDSRKFLLEDIPELAAEFLSRFSQADLAEDYINLVDEFSRKNFINMYGISEGSESQHFSIIRWSKDDLMDVFSKYKIPNTEENINIFLNSTSPRTLKDRTIEEGWEIIEILVSDMKEEFNLVYTVEDLAKEMINIYWSEGTLEKEIAEEWHELLSGVSNLGKFEPIYKSLCLYFENEKSVELNKLVESIDSVLKDLNYDYYLQIENEYKTLYKMKYM